MASILGSLGYMLLALSVALIIGSRWFISPNSTAGWWCSAIGLLVMLGGLISLCVTNDNKLFEALSELSKKSDAILADPLYAYALKIVNAKSEGHSGLNDDAIWDGVDYLVRNGIDEQEARKNLNIVLGSLSVERSNIKD